jgi:hypothetical protein
MSKRRQALFRRRRHQPRRPAQAKARQRHAITVPKAKRAGRWSNSQHAWKARSLIIWTGKL